MCIRDRLSRGFPVNCPLARRAVRPEAIDLCRRLVPSGAGFFPCYLWTVSPLKKVLSVFHTDRLRRSVFSNILFGRQIRFLRSCPSPCRFTWGKPFVFYLSIQNQLGQPRYNFSATVHAPIPVSYTHLDVYKRQEPDLSKQNILYRFTVRLARLRPACRLCNQNARCGQIRRGNGPVGGGQ